MRNAARTLVLAVTGFAMVSLGPQAAHAAAAEAPPSTGDGAWVHVQVDDSSRATAHIDVRVPLSLLDLALGGIADHVHGGTIEIDHHNVSIGDLRRSWRDLMNGRDNVLVDVSSGGDERVRIWKDKGRFRLAVSAREGGKAKVDIDLPATVIDALLGSGESFDLAAARRSLGESGHGEILRIDNGSARIRITVE